MGVSGGPSEDQVYTRYFYVTKTLMSFYEDREEEGGENVDLWKKKQRMCFCLKV